MRRSYWPLPWPLRMPSMLSGFFLVSASPLPLAVSLLQ
ncbi:hypothetical protein yruck0001_8110 [Yersinia ruckeri ATCC 29473]|nr:hypothetical protein yruck0001_8110 [Yersinia ruckeri ATCC 29473]